MNDVGIAAGGHDEFVSVVDLRTWLRVGHQTVRAVDGITMTVARNQMVAVVGESGSGKSVLMRSIMRLVPTRLIERSSGHVWMDGVDLLALDESAMRMRRGSDIAIVLQDPMTSLNPVVRIGRQLTETIERHLGLDRADARDRAVELLTQVGISNPEARLRQYPHEFSGGMRQRVTIAMALSCDPRLLIADEPTTALDVTVQAQILALLQRERRSRGMSLIFVTHDLGVAAQADVIVVMYAGQVVERAPAADLFARPRMPYTTALLRALPRLEHLPHTRLPAISGRPPDLSRLGAGCRFSSRCPKVQPKCREEDPPLTDDGFGHHYRCWYPE